MRVLVDSDVLLDVALERTEFVTESTAVVAWCEQHADSGWVAWHSLSNIHYVGRLMRGNAAVRDFLGEILSFLAVPSTDHAAARQALGLPIADFEDALQVVSALAAKADFIVTRNTADYRRSPVPSVTPADFLRRVRA